MAHRTFRPRHQFFNDLVGVFLVVVNIILLLCALLGCTNYTMRYFYFARLTQLKETNNIFLFGMMGLCSFPVNGPIDCHQDYGALIYPFDVTAANFLNDTYPSMFHDQTAASVNDINAAVNPPHDPHIFVAVILTILADFASIAFATARHIPKLHYSDKYYNRGFTSLFACSVNLLILGLVQIMYVNGVLELNTRFPNIAAESGTAQGLVSASFVCLVIASIAFLQGCTAPQPSTGNNVGFEKLF